MVETVISSLLVGVVLVTTLQIVAPVVQSGTVMSDKLIASNLARELTDEIATRKFVDIEAVSFDLIGVDDGEDSANRTHLDDVDDFDGWSASPPQLSDKTDLDTLGRWRRAVSVDHVLKSDAKTVSITYTGLKMVTVRVYKDSVLLAELSSLHAHAADQYGFVVQE